MGRREGLAGQVGNPITYLVMTRRDEAAFFKSRACGIVKPNPQLLQWQGSSGGLMKYQRNMAYLHS